MDSTSPLTLHNSTPLREPVFVHCVLLQYFYRRFPLPIVPHQADDQSRLLTLLRWRPCQYLEKMPLAGVLLLGYALLGEYSISTEAIRLYN
jgi:hypothetical protein